MFSNFTIISEKAIQYLAYRTITAQRDELRISSSDSLPVYYVLHTMLSDSEMSISPYLEEFKELIIQITEL